MLKLSRTTHVKPSTLPSGMKILDKNIKLMHKRLKNYENLIAKLKE